MANKFVAGELALKKEPQWEQLLRPELFCHCSDQQGSAVLNIECTTLALNTYFIHASFDGIYHERLLPWKLALIAGTKPGPVSKGARQKYPNIRETCFCRYLQIPINLTHASCATRKAARAFLSGNKRRKRTE